MRCSGNLSEAAGDHAKGVIGPGVLQEKSQYKHIIHWIRLFWTDPDPPGPYDIGRLSCVPQDFTLYRKIACPQATRCSE